MGRLGCLTLAAVLGVALIVWAGTRQALVPFSDLLQVETELAEQAGCAYSDRLLLDALKRAAVSPQEHAEIARRRCALEHAADGPQVALPICRAAVEIARQAGEQHLHRAHRRLALVLLASGDARAARRELDQATQDLPDPLEVALDRWAIGEAELALGHPDLAQAAAWSGLEAAELAVDRDPKRRDYLALAHWHVGRAWAVTAPDLGRHWLRKALEQQRQIDARDPEYAEFKLYLCRILLDLGALPGEEAAAQEAQRLGAELRRRDPQRWEYGAGLAGLAVPMGDAATPTSAQSRR